MKNMSDDKDDGGHEDGIVGGETLPLPKARNLYFTSQVNQESIAAVSKAILEINASDRFLAKQYAVYDQEYIPKPIKLYIDSYGGYVYQCFGLLGIMDNSKTPIHTIVTGAAMSCGFMMAIHGHKRFAYKHATLMYHQVSSHAWGKLKDMEEDIQETTRLQEMIENMTVRRTKLSPAKLKDCFDRKRDWFMAADEALKNGCIDAII